MNDGSVNEALDRIEAAMARLEQAAAAAPADTDLRRRHQRLRLATADSLRMIDLLIADRQSESRAE